VLESPHFSSGATATFDYNSSNTPDFGVFVQHLTNNSNEILTSFVYPFDKDGVRQGGGGGGNFESYLFPTFENLASWQPEFVRLIAESVAIQENPPYWDPQGRWIYGYHYSYGVRWEIWGTDVPTTCVPEPSTMLLLGSGLIGLLELRRKSKK
jgi:hypothetical protein